MLDPLTGQTANKLRLYRSILTTILGNLHPPLHPPSQPLGSGDNKLTTIRTLMKRILRSTWLASMDSSTTGRQEAAPIGTIMTLLLSQR